MTGSGTKVLSALALTACVVLLAIPARAASHAIQIRYWPSSTTGTYGSFVIPYNTSFTGFSVRSNVRGDAWAVSFNFDRGPSDFPGLGPGQYTQTWNLNIHRQFPLPAGMVGVYVGWSALAFEAPNNSPAPLHQRQQSLQFGLDGRVNLRRGWYITADVALRPGAMAEFNNTFVPGLSYVQTESFETRLGLGRRSGPWQGEIGYRWLTWSYAPGPSTCSAAPCADRWEGWFAAVNFILP